MTFDFPIVVVDCETGGLNPQNHSLLSVGAILLNGDLETVDEAEWSLKDDTYHVTSEALRINGIDLTEYNYGARIYAHDLAK